LGGRDPAGAYGGRLIFQGNFGILSGFQKIFRHGNENEA
jgi:hypothetical protein